MSLCRWLMAVRHTSSRTSRACFIPLTAKYLWHSCWCGHFRLVLIFIDDFVKCCASYCTSRHSGVCFPPPHPAPTHTHTCSANPSCCQPTVVSLSMVCIPPFINIGAREGTWWGGEVKGLQIFQPTAARVVTPSHHLRRREWRWVIFNALKSNFPGQSTRD